MNLSLKLPFKIADKLAGLGQALSLGKWKRSGGSEEDDLDLDGPSFIPSSAGEDDDDGPAPDQEDQEGAAADQESQEGAAASEADSDTTALDSDDFDEQEEDGSKRLIVLAAAGAGLFVLIAGVAWWVIGGDGSRRGGEPGVPWVELKVPPRGGPTTTRTPARTPTKEEEEGGEGQVIEVPATEVPAVTIAAYGGIPERNAGEPLSAVPDAGLIEQSAYGPLPIVGVDGRQSWRVYARPTPLTDDRPKIAIIMGGLGLSAPATEAAIRLLPADVTLAFDPYGKGLDDWVPQARRYGHEFLLYLPSEPREFPIVDAGPFALETVLDTNENLRRLDFILSRLSGYVGVVTGRNSVFTAEEKHIRPILEAIKDRGLMIVDGGGNEEQTLPTVAAEINLPRAINDLLLDEQPSRAAIDRQLARLEEISRQQSVAVAFAEPYPSTIDRIVAWAATLERKNLALVPVSSLADRQTLP